MYARCKKREYKIHKKYKFAQWEWLINEFDINVCLSIETKVLNPSPGSSISQGLGWDGIRI